MFYFYLFGGFFFNLVNWYFQVSRLQFKGCFVRGQSNSKYRDWSFIIKHAM